MAPENKTQWTGASVSDFLDGVHNVTKREDARKLLAMMEEITGEPAEMVGPSIVSFGRYQHRDESGREGDGSLVGFAPRRRELVVYIMPGFSQYGEQLAKLGKHKHGSSCLYIKRLSDVDLDVLREIVADSVAVMRKKYPA